MLRPPWCMPSQIRELYEFDAFRLDAVRRVLIRGDQPVPLTSKAFDTLLVLIRNRDRVLTKDELMKTLWPETFVEEVNLAQNVSGLRKALGETPGENRFIATVPGKGYRFVAAILEPEKVDDEIIVARHTHAQMVVIEDEDADGPASFPSAQLPVPSSPRRSPPGWKWMGAAFLVLLLAGGVWLWRNRGGQPREADGVHSLAVLPFQPLSGNDDEHLGLGVADAVITKLSNFPELSVRPTDVAVRYSDPKADPLQAGRDLGADSVLSGKIQESGQRIRLTVQLIRVRDGRPLWAQAFDENAANIFTIEDSISEKVAAALAVHLAGREEQRLVRHYTENIPAYRDYLEGRFEEFTFTRDGMNKAIDYFSQAIAADPGYALAYAGLADAYTTESDWLLAPREALPKAEAAARKALVFDNNLAEAHGALAHALLHEWRLPEANSEFHTALTLNPANVSTYFAFAEYLASTGQADQAIAAMQKALTIDPLSPEINSFLGWDYYLKRDYGQCLATSHKAMQMFPEFWVPHMIAGMCSYIQSNFTESLEEYSKALAMDPESTFSQAGVGMSLARLGRRNEALKTIETLKATSSKTYVSPGYIGMVYLALGDGDSEYAWFAKGYEDQAEWLLWLPVEPLFDGQRNDPRLLALVSRVRGMR
jgi:DNA-binding winged helix-turn-helix (wHTH) protein/TolB-like protein/Tfp pilus assembly protein PilF